MPDERNILKCAWSYEEIHQKNYFKFISRVFCALKHPLGNLPLLFFLHFPLNFSLAFFHFLLWFFFNFLAHFFCFPYPFASFSIFLIIKLYVFYMQLFIYIFLLKKINCYEFVNKRNDQDLWGPVENCSFKHYRIIIFVFIVLWGKAFYLRINLMIVEQSWQNSLNKYKRNSSAWKHPDANEKVLCFICVSTPFWQHKLKLKHNQSFVDAHLVQNGLCVCSKHVHLCAIRNVCQT